MPYKTESGSYVKLPFIPFVLGIVAVAAPIEAFKAAGKGEWVWRYIFLITLSLVVYYWKGITAFTDYFNGLRNG